MSGTENDRPTAPLPRRAFLAGSAAVAGMGVLGEGLVSPASAASGPAARGRAGRPPVPAPIVLVGGTLLDPLSGKVTENAVVVLSDGKVLVAGGPERMDVRRQQALARKDSQARIIDVSGSWLLPGLLDAHTHATSIESANRALQRGATTLRMASANFYADVALAELARWVPEQIPRVQPVGLFVRPFFGDNILSDPDLAPLATDPEAPHTPAQLRRVVRVNLARGADHIKTWATQRAGLCEQDPREPTYTLDQLRVIVRAAGGRPVMCHSHGAEGCHNAVRAGVTSLEHGTYVSERTLDLMATRGTYYDPTISAMVDLLESGGEYDEPCLQERGREMLPVLQEATRQAYQRGIPIVAGPDTSYSSASVSSVGGEVVHLHTAGLSALDAIRASTTVAARMMRLQRKVGRLVSGFAADLIAIDGSPLDDITAMERVQLVIHGGAIARNDLSAGRLQAASRTATQPVG